MTSEYLQYGDRVRLDDDNPRYKGRIGTFVKYDRNGFAVVKWHGNRSTSVFHRNAIARATGSETNDSGPPDEKLSRWKAAAAMDPGPCVEVGSKTREG
jgi:hypothetical protein